MLDLEGSDLLGRLLQVDKLDDRVASLAPQEDHGAGASGDPRGAVEVLKRLRPGAGSVILLWGQAGEPIVELVHLKQPAEEVGPLKIEHDHHVGVSTVTRGFDALRFLQLRRGGASTIDVARAMFEKSDPTDAQRAKARRQLERLVREGLAMTLSGGASGGAGGTSGTVFVAVDRDRQEETG